MPLNESRGVTRSNLTREQQRQAEAAIFGLPGDLHIMAPGQLTHDEIERMRQIVMQHDQHTHKGIKEFDLNNPPKEPYRHQEFPRMVYDHQKRRQKIVHTPDHLGDALDAGWKKEPFPSEVEEIETLTAAERAEAEALDREARKPRKPKSE